MASFLVSCLLLTAPEPPARPRTTTVPIIGMQQATLPAAVVDRLERLEEAKDWQGVAAFIAGLEARRQDALLATWFKALDRMGDQAGILALAEQKVPGFDGPKGPRLSVPRVARAQALRKLGRMAEAASAYLENGLLGQAEAIGNAFHCARQVEDWGLLLQVSEGVLGRWPGDGEALAWKGEALVKLGRFPEAEPVLQAAVAKVPDRAVTWADLGACLQLSGRLEEALQASDRALALDAGCLEARYNRARALVALRRYPEAREQLISTLAIAQDPGLRATLQQTLEATDRYLASQARKAEAVQAKGKRGR